MRANSSGMYWRNDGDVVGWSVESGAVEASIVGWIGSDGSGFGSSVIYGFCNGECGRMDGGVVGSLSKYIICDMQSLAFVLGDV